MRRHSLWSLLLILLSTIPLTASRCSNIEQQLFPPHQNQDISPAPIDKANDDKLFGKPAVGALPRLGAPQGPLQGARPTDSVKSGPMTVTIDLTTRAPISPYIYGFNAIADPQAWDRDNNLTFYRMGGNRMTAYNWENNLSHAGLDFHHQNDLYLCSKPLPVADCSKSGAVYTTFIDKAFGLDGSGLNASVLVTVPMIGYVASQSTDGDVCPVDARSDDGGCKTRDYLGSLFRRSLAHKTGTLSLTPELSDANVYQDEFVNFLLQTYPSAKRQNRQIFFSLDNELALWASSHRRLRPSEGKCTLSVTYSEALKLNIEYALAVKDVYADAVVFGPVDYGWYSMVAMQGVGSCDGLEKRDFYDYYLAGLHDAAIKSHNGKPLVDVLDFHWYSEIRAKDRSKKIINLTAGSETSDDADSRMQSPRSLWDPAYVEDSWITETIGSHAIALLPRLQDKINRFNPGMGLAITEYNMGGEDSISGAIAEADMLGVFGREGLFAATFYPINASINYIYGAFKIFRNYDGQHSTFGDIAVSAVTDSASRASVYASIDSKSPDKLIIVAINKTRAPLSARLALQGSNKVYRSAKVFQLSQALDSPLRAPDFIMDSTGQRGDFTMPPLSISTLEFSP